MSRAGKKEEEEAKIFRTAQLLIKKVVNNIYIFQMLFFLNSIMEVCYLSLIIQNTFYITKNLHPFSPVFATFCKRDKYWEKNKVILWLWK